MRNCVQESAGTRVLTGPILRSRRLVISASVNKLSPAVPPISRQAHPIDTVFAETLFARQSHSVGDHIVLNAARPPTLIVRCWGLERGQKPGQALVHRRLTPT